MRPVPQFPWLSQQSCQWFQIPRTAADESPPKVSTTQPTNSFCQKLSVTKTSKQKGCKNNIVKRVIMTDRLGHYHNYIMDKQLGCRSEAIGNLLLSSNQQTHRDLIMCGLLMDRDIRETDTTYWTPKNIATPVHQGMRMMNPAQPHVTTKHHFTTQQQYTHRNTLVTLLNLPFRTRFDRQIKPRVILDLWMYKGVGGSLPLTVKWNNVKTQCQCFMLLKNWICVQFKDVSISHSICISFSWIFC